MSRAQLLELLGLHGGATRDEIKARYRELARKFHPDVNAGDERAHARFRAIAAAYQELLVADSDTPSPGDAADVVHQSSRITASGRDVQHAPRVDDRLARRRTELRTRLDQRTKLLQRAQAEARDGDAKAVAARGRGNGQMARHFDRRAEADRNRIYALLNESAELERELHGLDSVPGDPAAQQTRVSPERGRDSLEWLKVEAERVSDEERAALEKRYNHDGKRR